MTTEPTRSDDFTPHGYPMLRHWLAGNAPTGLHADAMEAEVAAVLAEVERLRRWKAEATVVLSDWEQAWEAAGRPGLLGSSKAKSTVAYIHEQRICLDALSAGWPS